MIGIKTLLSRPSGQAAAWAVGGLAAWAIGARVLERGLPLGIILLGAVFGSLYGLIAAGLVLVYRSNRIVNFAQAELGGVAAVTTIQLVTVGGWGYIPAVVLGLVLAAGTGALVDIAVIRRFRNAPRLILSVATIGLAQIFAGLALLIPILVSGLVQKDFVTPFEASFEVFPVYFTGNHLTAVVSVLLSIGGLFAFLRFTDYGIAIRAAAENRDRADLVGIPVARLSTLAWSIAAVLSTLAILMRVPLLGFTAIGTVSGGGNALLLRTLAAAVIGRMENLPRTFIAAVGIGIFQESALWTTSNTNLGDAMLFGVLLVALLAQRGSFERAAQTGIATWQAVRDVRPIPPALRGLPEVRIPAMLIKLGGSSALLAGPVLLRPSQEAAITIIFVYSIVAVSLAILTGWAGQISLGQFALTGIGGATTALLYARHGIDLMVAVPLAAAFTAMVSLVIGFPALRIRGPFLAVTTLAFAVTASTYFLEQRYVPWFVEEGTLPRPMLWGRLPLDQPWQRYELTLISLAGVLVCAQGLRRSRAGRAIVAVRDNEAQASAMGISVTRAKLTAFALSGAIAGFAGSLYVLDQGGLFTDAFDAEVSVRLFTMGVIGGLGSLPGAVLGAVYVRSAEFFLDPQWALVASGVGILFLLMFLPEGLGGLLYRLRDRYLRMVAARRDILVPSLLADRRVEDDDSKGFDPRLLERLRSTQRDRMVDAGRPDGTGDVEDVDDLAIVGSDR